jgi:hypothetical protein
MKIQVTTGDYQGRYVGPNFFGLRTNPILIASPEIKLPGKPYSLFTQEQAATNFPEAKALEVQAELRTLGFDSVLI